MPQNEARLLDALVELANLRERDERMRRTSDAIARALQALGEGDDWEHGPERLLEHLSEALGVPDVVLFETAARVDPLAAPHTDPELVACARSQAWLDYLAKRPWRALADPAALDAALGLTLPVSGLSSLLCGRLEVDVHRFLVVCAETDGRRHLLEPAQQDLFRRFLPIFGQALRRRADGQRARESAARERELAVAKEAAEQASRAKSEFVSRMSHELRTPLNAVIGFAELLQAEPLTPSQQHFVGLITSSGKHLMELINTVLDHAKIEAGGVTLERMTYDLGETIEAVRDMVQARANAKGLDLSIDTAPDLPRRLVGDPTRLRQVLINLINNAIKFTDSGRVQLSVTRHAESLLFQVRDTGIGMDAAMLERLFKPFMQADESITRKYGGTGLGLVISKELVEAMGGRIEVESQVEVGTKFRVFLPLHQASEAQGRHLQRDTSSRSESADLPVSDCVPGRILVVDDNWVNQQLAAAMLGRLDLEFELADDGLIALERIARHPYALILMDMEMPGLDGLSTTRRIRELERDRGHVRVPIIAMTANALSEDRQRCSESGMDGYISKPMSLSVLEREIRRVLAASLGGSSA
jgi:signal transduction histidine kinase/ActR/RegA family two-component response regulator